MKGVAIFTASVNVGFFFVWFKVFGVWCHNILPIYPPGQRVIVSFQHLPKKIRYVLFIRSRNATNISGPVIPLSSA